MFDQVKHMHFSELKYVISCHLWTIYSLHISGCLLDLQSIADPLVVCQTPITSCVYRIQVACKSESHKGTLKALQLIMQQGMDTNIGQAQMT